MKNDANKIKITDTPHLLHERHPALTHEEHHERIITALHEVSHMIVAMQLSTGYVGNRLYIRVPRQSTRMCGTRGTAGKVACGADYWEDILVDYAGVVGSYISGDPNMKYACNDDIYNGKTTLHELAHIKDARTILDIRQDLITCAAQITVNSWEIIDLIATAMLLESRKDGGLEDKRFCRVVALARKTMEMPEFQRDVCFPVPPVLINRIEEWRSRNRIAQIDPSYFPKTGARIDFNGLFSVII